MTLQNISLQFTRLLTRLVKLFTRAKPLTNVIVSRADHDLAARLSAYLLTGMHHSTPEAREYAAMLIATQIVKEKAEQSQFFIDSTRCIIRDKDQQIKQLQALLDEKNTR